jgi:3' terminal RNA ribose 2'-O-methyltransferase Hen1
MLLTISTTHSPAADLGWLLHKHPDKVQSFDIAGGQAHIFYPITQEDICTAALVVDVDPVDIVRTMNIPQDRGALAQYVNDRPYTASSFLTTAISKVYSSALNGICHPRPELVEIKMPFEVKISVIKMGTHGEDKLKRLFEPLGYSVNAFRHSLDEKFPDWGESPYYTVTLSNTLTIKDLLSHIYVLLPVFDNEKHYYISKQEIEKLISKGGEWLVTHPKKEFIIKRYLRNINTLTKTAITHFEDSDLENNSPNDSIEEVILSKNTISEKKANLHQLRLDAALIELKKNGSKTVVDMGCGEGKLLKMMIKEAQFDKILGVDVSMRELQKAKSRLKLEEISQKMRDRLELIQGSITYRDKRIENYDALVMIEVIEHLELERIPAMERVVFECANPQMVIITTPNAEYNALYNLEEDSMRHNDHRFEWTRQEFKTWSESVAEKYNYAVKFTNIGDLDEKLGSPSQMAVFKNIKKS